MKFNLVHFSLFFIFICAVIIRFLYFPNNIYFGFDQARDAFVSQEIFKGDLKIVGPPTGVDGWFHGPLYYYFYAPIYAFSSGNPEYVAAILRIANAFGIFLVFLIGLVIFNRWVGVIAAFLFAISFEQTQYALYFNHPSLAVLSVLIYYLGLSMLFFKKKQVGLIIASLGLGLSLQFEFVLIYLFLTTVVMFLIFRKLIPKIDKRIILKSIAIFILTTLTFIVAEIKFQFRSVTILLSLFSSLGNSGAGINKILANINLISQRLISDNLVNHQIGILLFIILVLILFFKVSKIRPKLIFLIIWFISGSLPFLNNKSQTPLYYYSVGASVSLLILYAFIIQRIFTKSKIIALVLLIIPLISNIYLITNNNKYGSMATINVQSGMLLSDEKKVIDYIYNTSSGKPFAVNAVTMPLNVNTTWSYLFEWYGIQKYGFIPIWGGNAASGYPGSLKINNIRSDLPQQQFLIIEPTRGIRASLITNMLQEESYFTKIINEEKIGEFIVQTRQKI